MPASWPFRVSWSTAGFAALSLVATAAAFWAASASPFGAALGVLAVSTAGAMHARLAIGRWPAALQVGLSAGLLFLIASPRLSGAVLVAGLAGAEIIARASGRSAVLKAGSWTGVLAGLCLLGVTVTSDPRLGVQALGLVLGAVAGGILSGPLLLTVGPLAEWLFGHTTRLTMSEWLSYDHRLLREMASAAPGTFQHSVNVGVLADAAARAIRADALMARVGGLYHDIGKSRAPEFFVENQHGSNPHDRLDPRESARLVRAHVHDGVEAVRAHGMGERVAAFVREHHGTGTMRLFRDKAAAAGLLDGQTETYRYPGPRPRSRETGLVMIADQLEATARSAPPLDEAACEDVVHRTFARIRSEGELDDSGLTGRDFARLEAAFARTLYAMYHRRLTYPQVGVEGGAPPRPASPTASPDRASRATSGASLLHGGVNGYREVSRERPSSR